MNKRKIGSRYEEAAAAFLQKQGFRILGKNFRCRQGEIDLVCREGKELVFTEVKTRTSTAYGTPAEAVDRRKQAHIIETALAYLVETGDADRDCRFDVAEILEEDGMKYFRYIENAFEA